MHRPYMRRDAVQQRTLAPEAGNLDVEERRIQPVCDMNELLLRAPDEKLVEELQQLYSTFRHSIRSTRSKRPAAEWHSACRRISTISPSASHDRMPAAA